MTNENNASGEKKTINKAKIFETLSAIFYIMAFVFLLIGIFRLIFLGISEIGKVEHIFDDDFGYNSMSSYSYTIQSFFSCFFKAFIFFFIGTIFKSIAKSIDSKKVNDIKTTITTAIDKVSDSISKKIEESESDSNSESKVKKEKVYCAYCSNELDENDKKCPYCGASKKIRKENDN